MLFELKGLHKKIIFPMLLGTLFLFAWYLQQHILFNRDVSWLLEASRRLLAGGNYVNNFFENNPPWILYFYRLPVILTKYLSIHIILSLQLCVFLLASCSLIICWNLLKSIFIKSDRLLAKIILMTLAFIFLLLPSSEFGQREHLLVILSMPYFLLVAARLQGISIQRNLAVIVGLMAGSGFLMKPYFVPTFLLVECYYLFCNKRFFAIFRAETITIIMMALLYIALILTRHMDYLLYVVPFAARWCGVAAHELWSVVLNHFLVIYSINAGLLYLFIYFDVRYRSLVMVLICALVGFLFSYFIQQTIWYYHQIPALSIAFLLYVLLFCMKVTSTEKNNVFSSCAITIYFIVTVIFFLKNSLFYLNGLFAYPYVIAVDYFVVLFLMALLVTSRQYKKISLSSWYGLLFYMVLGFLLFLPPIFIVAINDQYAAVKKKQYLFITDYINQHASGQAVYFLTSEIAHAYPVITYSKAMSASRFSYFWALGGLVKQTYLPMTNEKLKILLADKKYFVDMVSEDIRMQQPKLIFVDVSPIKNNFYYIQSNKLIRYLPFNYIDYFSKNANFSAVLRSYRYKTMLNSDIYENMPSIKGNVENPLYQLAVYERVTE